MVVAGNMMFATCLMLRDEATLEMFEQITDLNIHRYSRQQNSMDEYSSRWFPNHPKFWQCSGVGIGFLSQDLVINEL